MGRKSVNESKSYYQIRREAAGLTREKASECMNMSPSRLERIEKNASQMVPEDLLLMEEHYHDHTICNHYCVNDCAIGQKYVPEIERKNISRITIEIVNCLSRLNREKERFLEIMEDEQITNEEKADYERIRGYLQQIRKSADSLMVWIDEHSTKGSP